MNYKYVENLVLLCKSDNEAAKENLISEFDPLILNLCKKSFVSGYEFEDIKNECYKALFNCIKLYEPNKHRFVAYATNAIQNSVKCLIRKSVRRQQTDGAKVVTFDATLESVTCYDMNFVEDIIYQKQVKSQINSVINTLTEEEKDLVRYVFYKGYSMKKYSDFSKIPYYKVFEMKTSILAKLKSDLKIDKQCVFLN
ncbi:sigma-70 family RNA polymerase sigma factor [Clostridium sp. YIM B02505]|uniref:Sigma-70 family RNA polymerase sigma factor n=1 Tax=Clostridium yunnanense TaxID=2800325 RepID=A0ABS1ERN7_9CLOT|nr:sigma-70 family RNA polymerase sigma factor [Clostridium yunnanense]MBK1812046.1 sigma-70 family RNA polymerase sigma factor [Clostridium yunnanense]